jgi:hypothetical protein
MVLVRENDVPIKGAALYHINYAERTVEVLPPRPSAQTARRSMRGKGDE